MVCYKDSSIQYTAQNESSLNYENVVTLYIILNSNIVICKDTIRIEFS